MESIEELEASLEWKGSTVFVESYADIALISGVQSQIPEKRSATTPSRPSSVPSGGSSTSPISVASSPASSSTSPSQLPRPRGRAHYTSPLPRTAFTPPKVPHQDRPIHPFFSRDFRRTRSSPVPAPPQTTRPRLIAHYSSTSASVSGSGSNSQTSTQASQVANDDLSGPSNIVTGRPGHGRSAAWKGKRTDLDGLADRAAGLSLRDRNGRVDQEEEHDDDEEVEQIEESRRYVTDKRLDELQAMLDTIDLPHRPYRPAPLRKPLIPIPSTSANRSTTTPDPPVTASFSEAPKAVPPSTSGPASDPPLDLPDQSALPETTLSHFSYHDIEPRPKVVYTDDMNEADDLISCLMGQIIAFDMEWPISGQKDPDTGRKVGMVWTGSAYRFCQPKTALVQVCDENMVILIHVWGMQGLPKKLVELLENREVYKIGVNIRLDGLKLLRDFPDAFPNGIMSLLDLSNLARKVDPVRTGPGTKIIAFQELVKAYLGLGLAKDDLLRKNGWMGKLNQAEIDYAVNDVVASIELHKALMAFRPEHLTPNELEAVCDEVGTPAASKHPAKRNKATSVLVDDEQNDEVEEPVEDKQPISLVKPREERVLTMFKEGTSIEEIATVSQIKIQTAQSYIIGALLVLPPDELDVEQKARLMAEIPPSTYIWRYKQNRELRDRLRQDLGEAVDEVEEGGEQGTTAY